MAARRHRCVHCWNLFVPNYRKRTKVKDPQKVCADCGPAVGHRFADQRYRLGRVAPRRASRKRARSPAPIADRPEDSIPPMPHGVTDVAVGPDVASRVHAHLAAIAVLVDAPAPRVGSVPAEPLPIGDSSEYGRENA